jgi:hypothetical protein
MGLSTEKLIYLPNNILFGELLPVADKFTDSNKGTELGHSPVSVLKSLIVG